MTRLLEWEFRNYVDHIMNVLRMKSVRPYNSKKRDNKFTNHPKLLSKVK